MTPRVLKLLDRLGPAGVRAALREFVPDIDRLNGRVKGNVQCFRPDAHNHGDRDPSLSIDLEKGWLKCFSQGCFEGNFVDFIAEMEGRSWSEVMVDLEREAGIGGPVGHRAGLTVREYANSKKLPENFLRTVFQLRDSASSGIAIPYVDEGGHDLFVRHRPALHRTGGRDGRFRQPRGVKLAPYGLWIARIDDRAILVEGESDAQTLHHHGYKECLGLPGAGTFKAEWIQHFGDAKRVYAVVDADDAGKRFVDRIARIVSDAGWTGDLYAVHLDGVKDVSDLHCLAPSDFRGRFDQALRDAVKLARNNLPEESDATQDAWDLPIPLGDFAPPPLPLDAIPSSLSVVRDFCVAVAVAYQVPVDLPFHLLLAVGGTALAKRIVVRVRPEHIEPVNLYVLVVMPSGTRKSAVFREMTGPIEQFEEAERSRLAGAVEVAATEHRIGEAALRRLEAKAAKEDPLSEQYREAKRTVETFASSLAKIPTPVLLRLIADDATPEKIASLLREQGGRIAVMSPEGGIFGMIAGRYSRTPNLDVYLKAFSGDTLRVDRVGRTPEQIVDPALTICLTVQPEVLRSMPMAQEFRGRGFFGRFLYCIPKNLLGRRRTNAPPVPVEARQAYHELMTRCLALSPTGTTGQPPRPHVVGFSAQALHLLDNFAREVERELSPAGRLGSMTDWGGKLVGAVARVAGIFHGLAHVEGGRLTTSQIDVETIECAILLGRYLADHAMAAYSMVGADPSVCRASQILQWIRDGHLERFSRRDVHQAMKGSVHTVTEIDHPLDILCDHGHLRREPPPRKERGRPPSPTYIVNPLWLAQNPQYPQKDPSESIEDSESPTTGSTAPPPTAQADPSSSASSTVAKATRTPDEQSEAPDEAVNGGSSVIENDSDSAVEGESVKGSGISRSLGRH